MTELKILVKEDLDAIMVGLACGGEGVYQSIGQFATMIYGALLIEARSFEVLTLKQSSELEMTDFQSFVVCAPTPIRRVSSSLIDKHPPEFLMAGTKSSR